MSDEFFLPEDTVEWISQKKSELLAWVLEHQSLDDLPVERHADLMDGVAPTLASPDEAWSQRWDGHEVHVCLKLFERPEMHWMFVVSLSAPVINRPGEGAVLVPILVLPTWDSKWLRPWLKGTPLTARSLQ